MLLLLCSRVIITVVRLLLFGVCGALEQISSGPAFLFFTFMAFNYYLLLLLLSTIGSIRQLGPANVAELLLIQLVCWFWHSSSPDSQSASQATGYFFDYQVEINLFALIYLSSSFVHIQLQPPTFLCPGTVLICWLMVACLLAW